MTTPIAERVAKPPKVGGHPDFTQESVVAVPVWFTADVQIRRSARGLKLGLREWALRRTRRH